MCDLGLLAAQDEPAAPTQERVTAAIARLHVSASVPVGTVALDRDLLCGEGEIERQTIDRVLRDGIESGRAQCGTHGALKSRVGLANPLGAACAGTGAPERMFGAHDVGALADGAHDHDASHEGLRRAARCAIARPTVRHREDASARRTRLRHEARAAHGIYSSKAVA